MESLALVVSILVLICFFSGPLGFFLTSRLITGATSHPVAFVARRTLVVINGLLGTMVSGFFLFGPIPLFLRIISLASLGLNIWALDREFGSHIYSYIQKHLRNKNA
ncbi:unannotated protein [freshwater metagenome]|uniref:Unannotated protein n=1 Tax=freshwater metagenome TaxID=449393 RepID=A0A6J6ATI4_9ZZZZ